MNCINCDVKHKQSKYCVWFGDLRYKAKFFNNKKEAIQYAKSKKVEAYLNIYPCTDQEDTILGINVPLNKL